MWIMTNGGFLSVVDKGDDSGRTLLVRARRPGDIERAFPDATVQDGGGTDYRFRARIDREQVAQAVADQVRGISYGNFKGSVRDRRLHDAYMDVWGVMYGLQDNGR